MTATTTTTATMTTAKEQLASYIRAHGPVKTIRVSVAQARGAAKRYSYWGASRYQIELTRDGMPKHVALERARSDRRSHRLAEADAAAIAAREGRILVRWIHCILDEQQCAEILERLGGE